MNHPAPPEEWFRWWTIGLVFIFLFIHRFARMNKR